jgi:RNA polymerase sigma-70 factor (ECF subfamily)
VVISESAEAALLEEERRLIERAQGGDREAMRPIFERFAEPLYAGVILPRLGDAATAEDVLKDTFLTAIEKIGQFRWQGRTVYVWLRQIATNKVIDVHRRTARAGRLAHALAEELETTGVPVASADTALIHAEERRLNQVRIAQSMEALTARYREAIRLRLVEEKPREECAKAMNITVGNFDVLLFRAIRAFRKSFGELEGPGPGNGE